jgi:hypothetical protein
MINLEFKGRDLSKKQAKWLCENMFKEALSTINDYYNGGKPKLKHWQGERGIMMLSDFAGENLLHQYKDDFLDWDFSVSFEDFKSVSDFLNIA